MGKKTLLDLGNVVIQVDFRPFFAWTAKHGKYSTAEEYHFYLRSSLFYEFEFGQLPRKEFFRRSKELLGLNSNQDEFEEKFCAIFPGLVPGVEDFFQEFSDPVFCLTNTNEIHLEYIQKEYPIMERFAKIYSSYELQKRKPYPGTYREVAKLMECHPQDVIFFDDVAANVEGAIRAGLEAHVFQEFQGLRERLKEFQKTDDRANEGELP
jgi:HAD superfamily hydrolase (TIGR01509 family)